MKAIAFANNTASVIIWLTDKAIENCLGYSIRRIDVATGDKKALKAYLPFPGQHKDGEGWTSRTTDEWPIQGFKWKDFGGRPGASYKYEIVPMVGTPDNLKPLDEMAVITNEVSRSQDCGEFIKACFNRGILSTQKLASMLPQLPDGGGPDPEKLIEALKDPKSEIRQMLSRDLPEFIMGIFETAKAEGGHVYSALYELADPEIVEFLLANTDVFSLILGNAGEGDETNADARKRLHEIGADITDRILPKSQLPHNKSHVRKDKKGKPVEILTASANSTFTGLCCQSNNAVRIASEELAGIYAAYWDMLKADTELGELQGETLRAFNRKRREVTLPDGTHITAWFSPNTVEKTKPKTKPPVPVDMGEVFDCIDGAEQGVYFLAFYPGFPSIISKIDGMQKAPSSKKKHLFYRGAVSSPQALPRPFVPKPKGIIASANDGLVLPAGSAGASGIITPDVSGVFADLNLVATQVASPVQIFHHDRRRPVVIAADSLETAVGKWQRELLKLPEAHSIIHDKVVVIDPFGANPIVILGSHNLGFKASYANDENLLIIRGNHRLAAAYLVHILSVYDHYRFRSMVRNDGGSFEPSLEPTAAWQDRFFTSKYMSSKSRRELEYFISGAKWLSAAA